MEAMILSPHGTISLDKWCAEDLDVVNAAKVSMARYSTEMGEHEHNLIGFLMRNQHGSPFEHNYFKFRVRAPLSVAREWVRHRIGTSWNEESGRYVELRPDFYEPKNFLRTQVGKPGNYTYEFIDENDERYDEICGIYSEAYDECWWAYKKLLELGVAKELARGVLPEFRYTEWIWSCNARSLMAFCTLRNAPDAMMEIRLYAAAVEDFFAQIMPSTAEWFRSNK